MFTDILLVVMLETAKTTGVKQDKNNHNLSITHTVGFIAMLGLLIINHIFFLLKCKFLAKIIGHTINLCNFRLWKHSDNRLNVIIVHYKFNTFIAIFLIFSEIFICLYRTHVKDSKEFTDLITQNAREVFVNKTSQLDTADVVINKQQWLEGEILSTIFKERWFAFIKTSECDENVYFDKRSYKGPERNLVPGKKVRFLLDSKKENNEILYFATKVEIL